MIGFIGCGQMAQALAKGFVSANIYKSAEIILSDLYKPSLDTMEKLGYITTDKNEEVVTRCKVVVLAVKPNTVESILKQNVKPVWNDSKLLISICAGVSITAIQDVIGTSARVSRVMPNTPCLVNAAASCFSVSSACSPEDSLNVKRLMDAVGICYPVKETYLDAVTGLSGSGPAYIYTLIEALADAGVKGGLTRDVAVGLAAQTVLGSAKMVLETKQHPAVLRDQVTSPAGTTIAGVEALEKHGFRHAIMSAVEAARLRSIELAKAP